VAGFDRLSVDVCWFSLCLSKMYHRHHRRRMGSSGLTLASAYYSLAWPGPGLAWPVLIWLSGPGLALAHKAWPQP
jgi:hypothetical protein